MSRRPRSLLAIAAVVALAGCGGGGDAAGGGPAGSPAHVSGTVRWALLDYDPGVKPWAEKVAKAFEAKHPDVDVELTLPPVNAYQQLLTTQLRGKNPPDLAGVPSAWIPAFADADALVPWSDRLDAPFVRALDPRLVEGGEIDGKLTALPYLSTSRALFWNQAAFVKAGLADPPATWQEVVEDAERIEAKGAAEHGFALQGTGNEAFAAWFPYVYWSFGGELAQADGTLTIDQQACVQGVGVLAQMVGGDLTQPDVTASDVDEQLNLFIGGKAAMTISGPWLVGMLREDAEGLEYGVAPIPAGTESSTLDVADAYVLFKDGKNLDAATELAKFLYRPEIADEFVEGRGMLPVLTEGFSAPRYAKPPMKTFVDLVRQGDFVPMDAGWLKLIDTGTRALQGMYVDGKSPEETCDAIASAIG
jgi:multiple sugar transport system substrate-binding protein